METYDTYSFSFVCGAIDCFYDLFSTSEPLEWLDSVEFYLFVTRLLISS